MNMIRTAPVATSSMISRLPVVNQAGASYFSVIASCLIFFLCGLALAPYPGVQNDEALFAAPLYPPRTGFTSITVSHWRVPLMQMSYLGCLKAWIYRPIFEIWAPSVFSLRIPVLIIGTMTIWLTWMLLRRTLGDRAAIIGTLLLATDTSFLLTTCFDWGPVTLQHFLTVGGVLALVYFYRSKKLWHLGLGFLLFGLAIWDKALFSWTLAGLLVATSLVFPGELWKELRWQRVSVAAVCFVLGAFPLLWYNVAQGGKTFSSNARFSQQGLTTKWEALKETANGSALFGYLVADDQGRPLRPARTVLQRSSVGLSHFAGNPQRNSSVYAFLAALLALPLLWKTPVRKPMLFALILMVIIWLQMALTVGAGTGAHHPVLLWPWPMFLIAAGFSQLAGKLPRYGGALAIAALLFLSISSLLVTNQYLAELIENGPGVTWTDAIFPLADYLHMRTDNEIYSVDWGTTNSLRLLNRGTLRLQEATFTLLKDSPSQQDANFLSNMIQRRDALLVAHTSEFEAFKGINARLIAIATEDGYKRHIVSTIYDREGRAVFEVLRFDKLLTKP
jgi:4-amino-4-deoxy-L-arabinose transferase-like glycosyltransferase